MMHVLLGMLLLQRGNEWDDMLRAKGAFHLTDLRGWLLHALALLLRNSTEFLQDKVLMLFQSWCWASLRRSTSSDVIGWPPRHGNEHDVTQRARLDGKFLGRHHHSSRSP